MVGLLKSVIPQRLINTSYHLPKAVVANVIYGFPSKKIKIVGVTGTDGKTTTVSMIYHILNSMGKKVSMVSTTHAMIGDQKIDTGTHISSPGSFQLQKLIKKSLKQGSKYLILEVTSHGLDQHRFWGVKFDVGVVTNVTHEHLDYHKKFEHYLKTKSKLITKSKIAVLNKDDENYEFLSKKAKGKVVSFGLSNNADINPREYPIKLQIPGEFNQLNALAATAATLSLGVKFRIIQKVLTTFLAPIGRMEKIPNSKGLNIVIDFAHTPNGLQNALHTLRKQTSGKLISIIGAEGHRDVAKRPLLGQIAQNLSDIVIVTAVDPRGSLKVINQQIAEGAKKSGAKENKNFFVIEDRQQAINLAINKLATKGDTVGIFGKGHETTLDLDGKKELPWSDHQAVRRGLEGLDGRKD